MTPQEIMNGMRKKNQELSMKNDELKDLSENFAQAEENYNIELSIKMIKLRFEDNPVTLIPTLAKGDKNVAKLRREMIIAEGVQNACRESIKNHRGALETYRSLLSWMKAEMEISRHVPEK